MALDQLYKLICFIITGISIGIIFDIFRIIRKSFKVPDIITYIQDFLFWCITGIILLFSIFTFNNGELRAYIFIGIILGFILHIILISKYFIKFFVFLIKILKKVIGYPIMFVFQFIKQNIFRPIYTIMIKIYHKIPKINLKKEKNDNISDKIQ